MEYLLDSKTMKSCDSATANYFGLPSIVLMERAALSVIELIQDKKMKDNILVVCGTGNNGGDGLAIARILYERGYKPIVVLIGSDDSLTKEAAIQKKILEKYKINIESTIPQIEYTTIIDALFGIGLSREVEGIYYENISIMNKIEGCKIAIDIPSGISADTGKVLGIAFQADYTITFGFSKIGLVLYPGCTYCGKIIVKDIGITKDSFLGELPITFTYNKKDLQELPKRKFYSNKGTYGKILIIAGNINMSGAACLAGKSAYFTGSGLVNIFTSSENRIILQSNLPEAVLTCFNSEEEIEELLLESMENVDAIAIGPGCGDNHITRKLLELVIKNTKVPVVIDADGLNALSKGNELLTETDQPIILTPHLGEMSRLTGDDVGKIQSALLNSSKQWVNKYKSILVLKDARTIVTDSNNRVYINRSGNNGMATAGSGDVLTGIITSLIGQGKKPFEAASLAVYLHGLAGDEARKKYGVYSLMASHIIEGISMVLKEIN
ncbi:NAD(P)H-hydrate dehydratase [Anaerosacchariphilus polymeriproducens]|uniref:Bifunctional NAD(P)H-hydrate repair enzyme n=1 Tax=Anaerosacchariphilus polymeriproducens TaxID=1812858 RepID=A0A371ATY6_9FIRM|nr:NAD(P)H-hydrate dehydratase [Anaerosacchariphilus polymeriproducens]RDU23009.1 NAD(P)H-hydrate dehydratase [Anaerosacchariphilus polymeriproducens]